MLYTIVSVYPLWGWIVLTLATNCPGGIVWANCLDTAAYEHTFTRTSWTRLGRFVFHHRVLESVCKRYRNVWHRERTLAKNICVENNHSTVGVLPSSTIRTRGNYFKCSFRALYCLLTLGIIYYILTKKGQTQWQCTKLHLNFVISMWTHSKVI